MLDYCGFVLEVHIVNWKKKKKKREENTSDVGNKQRNGIVLLKLYVTNPKRDIGFCIRRDYKPHTNSTSSIADIPRVPVRY